jgi:hypothetical protein
LPQKNFKKKEKKKKKNFITPYHAVNFSVTIFHHFKKNLLEKGKSFKKKEN